MEQINENGLTEADMLARIRAGEVKVPPLTITLVKGLKGKSQEPDARLEIGWPGAGSKKQFVAELKAKSTPRAFRDAIEQAKGFARIEKLAPLVVLPYLSPPQLEELQREDVSGLDLCGNAIFIAPPRLLVFRSGAPNRFRASAPIKDIYRGNTSLVPRAFLLRPESQSLADLAAFIASKGGKVTLTTVSKALRRMEDDVLIGRQGGKANLLQERELLGRLARSYRPPKITRRLVGRLLTDSGSWHGALSDPKFCRSGTRAVLTGTSSVGPYAVMGRERDVKIYCESLSELVSALGAKFEETERFADAELLETRDTTVYFDVRPELGIPYASPIQAYLELQSGDKREQDTAAQIENFILTRLNRNTDG